MSIPSIRTASCSFALASLLALGATPLAQAAGLLRMPTAHVPAAVASGQAPSLGALDANRELHLALVLPLRDEAGLDRLLARLQDPSSPDFHHYLPAGEFAARFGASAADYAEVVAWARAQGLRVVATSANRRVVDVAGPVATIDRAFHVRMNAYRSPSDGRSFFAPDREPSVDLRVPLHAIAGLDDAVPRSHRLRRGDAAERAGAASRVLGSAPDGEYLPSDMRAAYYGAGPLTGAGQSVGIFSFDGYKAGDLAMFYRRTGMTSNVPVHNVRVAGFSGLCGDGGAGCDDGEQILDIVNVIGMAPGLSQVQFYEGDLATDILERMAADDTSKVLSCSWFGFDFNNAADDPIYKQMAAQGQTFVNATGDYGAYNLFTWGAPSADPWILDVGGTSLLTDGAGGGYVSEKGWRYSGGGFTRFAREATPAWQLLPGVANGTSGMSMQYRNDPDVSAEADFDNPTVSNGQYQTGFGGTSFAAPRWAGLLALANEQSEALGRGTVGFVNPRIYAIATNRASAGDFHDVTRGRNPPVIGSDPGFVAVKGFDLVTGWGSPAGAAFIDALTQ